MNAQDTLTVRSNSARAVSALTLRCTTNYWSSSSTILSVLQGTMYHCVADQNNFNSRSFREFTTVTILLHNFQFLGDHNYAVMCGNTFDSSESERILQQQANWQLCLG